MTNSPERGNLRLSELRKLREERQRRESPLAPFRDDNRLKPASFRLVRMDVTGAAFMNCPEGRWLQWSEGDENDQFLELSAPAFDAVPTERIYTSDLPYADDLEDCPDICERFGIKFCISDPEPGYIYANIGMTSGLIKLGFTSNLRDRATNQKSGSGEDIEHIGHFPGSQSLERYLHERFRPIKHHGEWYYPHPDLLDYVLSAIWW